MCGFRALLLQGGDTPAWAHMGGGGGEATPSQEGEGIIRPPTPSGGWKPVGAPPGVSLGGPPGGGPCREETEQEDTGGERDQKGGAWASASGLSPPLPDLLRPCAGASLSLLNLRPRLVCRTTGLALPSWAGESWMPDDPRPHGHPETHPTHPSLTRTHLRLFTKRKGPGASKHTLVPNSEDQPQKPTGQRCRACG